MLFAPRKFYVETVGWLWYWEHQLVIRLHPPPATVHNSVNFPPALNLFWRHQGQFGAHLDFAELVRMSLALFPFGGTDI